MRLLRTMLGPCVAAFVAYVLCAPEAHAIINQVDGTVVPVTNNMQSCLDKSSVFNATTNPAPGEGAGTIDARRDAAIRPQTFVPNPSTNLVTFTVLGEGAGYRNRFGWYHVGDSPFDPNARRQVFDPRSTSICACPCTGGARGVVGPSPNSCYTWTNPNTVRIDFACLQGAGIAANQRWRGGPIAFYLLTPERLDGSGSDNPPAENSTTNRVYSTDNTVNDDGDYVHFLIYESVTYANSFYFGFEDLFRGGDNDFEDMLVRANGLVPTCNPQPETCNNRDDNCDGIVDNFSEPCSSACGNGTRTCTAGTFSACTARTPSTEICNNIDDNCNGEVDEGISTACTAACGAGRSYCVGGVMTACVATRVPTTEICNNIDDNCNGTVDEGLTRACSSVCGAGTETCRAGVWGGCTAAVPGTEVCDGTDNDCDGLVDEMIPDGAACGSAVGACRPGVQRCVAGMMRCVGATGPGTEVCNGVDDDCDGMIDDGVAAGGACGRAVGACSAGNFVCRGGRYVCEGGSTGTPEVCNNIDDDCNGVVDDGIAAGGSCNMAADGSRLCMAGQLRCRAGMMVCEGGTRAGTEVCDCMDNDCDGMVDNVAAGAPGLCPGGGSCIACQCRTPCASGEFPCSAGLECREGFCVPPSCGGTVCRDGQRCVSNRCVDACEGVTCQAGQVCRNGSCREDSCYVLGCSDPTQVCIDGTCAANACLGVTCAANQFCRDGACVNSCEGVRCLVGNSCVDGACVPNACAGVACDSNTRCVLQDGRATCVPDACRAVTCGPGRRCDSSGACVDDACARIVCPGAAVCRAGQCESRVPLAPINPDRGVASGGACSASPVGAAGSPGALGALASALSMLFARRRRRAASRKSVMAASVLATGAALAGCRTEPYCFNCSDVSLDEATEPTDTGTNPVDVSAPESCVPSGDEVCDGVDNDCDGIVDEGFDPQTNPAHCGGCGMRCAVDHALPSCVAGRCGVATCDIGYYDLDRNPNNGCEYQCNRTGDNEVCDGLDNNCDGRRDEGIDLQTDVANCGRCDNACAFANATSQCVAGACTVGACAPGFVDADGMAANGCEYACLASGPEVCDGRDNDCDGMVDEGFNLNTDGNNCGRCGNVCRFDNAAGSCMAVGGTPTCTLGACSAGFVNADGQAANGCEYMCTPSGAETCDGRDNDCNGLVDDAIAGLGAACGSSDTGACSRGRTVCERGATRCVGEVGPSTEVCNGIDDDCDGATDEAPLPGVGAGTTCGTNVGRCAYGQLQCVSGAVVCGGGTTAITETCNGIDDDCDGAVDDGVTAPVGFTCAPGGMGTERGVCVGAPRACGGAMGWRCVLPPTYRNRTDEALCDGLDNNCDGRVDEGCLRLFPAGADVRTDSSPTTSNTIQPVITGSTNALGIAYLDNRAGNADIWFSRSTTVGASWAEQQISRDPGSANQVSPWITATGSRFYTAWSDFRIASNSRDTWSNASSNDGVTWANPDVRVSTSTTDRFNVRVVANGVNVTAVYEALFSNRERHINVSVSRDGGATWPTFVRVDHAAASGAQPIPVASTPSVAVSDGAMGAGSVIHVVWRDNRNGNTDVYYNRSTDFGATWLATDVRMDTDTAGARASSNPSVAADAAGNVLVVWQDNQTGTGTRFDIYSRFSTNAGVSFNASNVRVDHDTFARDSREPIALVTGGGAGNVAVVWLDDRDGLTQVYGNRSSNGGATWMSADVRVQTHTPRGTYAAQDLTAAASNGIVFVAWAEARDTMFTSPLDLRGNYSLDLGETYQPADVRLDSAGSDIDSEQPFAYSSGGVGHFVWVDRRADRINGDIYYRSLRP